MAEALTPDVIKLLVSTCFAPQQPRLCLAAPPPLYQWTLPACLSPRHPHARRRPAPVVPQTSSTARPVVRKKAALCLLRLTRKTPLDAQLISADSFAPIVNQLLEERDLGLLLCCVTLLLGICGRSGSGACWCGRGGVHACEAQLGCPPPHCQSLTLLPSSCCPSFYSVLCCVAAAVSWGVALCAAAGYELCRGKLVALLERLVYLRDVTPDYTYYGIASPWLQVPRGGRRQGGAEDALCAVLRWTELPWRVCCMRHVQTAPSRTSSCGCFTRHQRQAPRHPDC